MLIPLLLATPPAALPIDFDLGLHFTRFEQQVKSEVGGARGERLVETYQLSALTTATYRFWGPLSAGLYAWLDVGTRRGGVFTGLDADNKAVVEGEIGGGFNEWWLGPILRAEWDFAFVELGYGAVGRRSDDAREDLLDADGSASESLRTSPTIAWFGAAGAHVGLTEALDLTVRMAYRVRYYTGRGGQALTDDLVHGTQEFTPFIGLRYGLD